VLTAVVFCASGLAAPAFAAKKKKSKREQPPLAVPMKTSDVETVPLEAAAPPKQKAPAAAGAQPSLDAVLEPVPSMKEAEQLYQHAEFAKSILMLDKLLRSALDVPQKKQARLYMALNFLALGNDARARSAMQDLLDLDPDFVLPTFSSPSVRAFFQTVKSTYKIIPQIEHNPPSTIDAKVGVELHVTLARMRTGYQPKLFFRARGTPYYSNIDLRQANGDDYSATLPPAILLKPEGYALEYFVVVTEGADTPLVQLRDPQAPFSVPVDVPVVLEAKPVHKRWYFWVALSGAVLVAGGVTAAVVLTRPQANPYGDANVLFRF
jgi:hypothetical protein